jgi:predicted oxidoreductase (fatty acid repression mutant protein)
MASFWTDLEVAEMILGEGTSFVGGNPVEDSRTIGGTTYTVQQAFANATTSGNTQVVALTSGKRVRVLKYTISASAAVNVYFNSSGSGAISATKYLAAAGSGIGAGLCHFGHFQTAVGEALQVNLSTSANVGVDVLYILV